MFTFPKQAEFNRALPKSKIYAFAKPTRAVKDRIVSGIQDIVWKYKLAPETVNLPARHGIQEIQVLDIRLKTAQLAEEVLRAIDQAIPSPIFHHLLFEGRERWAAAYKRPSATGTGQVVETYFHTDWQPPSTFIPQPSSFPLDMAALYEEMLCRVIPLSRRPGEPLSGLVGRAMQLRSKERECRDLEARLRRERQFNRKVEINAALRSLQYELKALETPETTQ